ncbi:MAG: hypothetical protein IPO83_10820 [Chitinophagaceae bacterium]|nr:hypothetical protein [Chitinophagaceae bacterium]
MVQLIVDSGSTKADWRLMNDGVISAFTTRGLNPYFLGKEELEEVIRLEVLPLISPTVINRIFFYGAGCGAEIRKQQVQHALRVFFPQTTLFIGTDLLGAAKALLKNDGGFVIILGTGTNSGLYDGKEIIQNIDSLGYLLGDEGSGAAIGKKILREYLRKLLPETLQKAFSIYSPLNREEVLHQLYKQPYPNRFLASLVPFAAIHVSNPAIQELIKESFRDFFRNIITHYQDYARYPFCCTGSVAFVFRELLQTVAAEYGVKIHKILQSPIDEMVGYHLFQS